MGKFDKDATAEIKEPEQEITPCPPGTFVGGGMSTDGKIIVKDCSCNTVFSFLAKSSRLKIGDTNKPGRIVIKDENNQDSLIFASKTSRFSIRINGRRTLHFDANTSTMTLGNRGYNGILQILDEQGNERILLDGNTGDIRLSGADCAEEFDVLYKKDAPPGTVLVFNDKGNLEPSYKEYDKKVAGVVSGAGEFRPGIVLDTDNNNDNRVPVALSGKTFCNVYASNDAIEVGDMLTTSSIFGHAMKASDHNLAFGSVLGKALSPLKHGKGLIPILVSLQ